MWAFVKEHAAVLNHPKLEQELQKIKGGKCVQNVPFFFLFFFPLLTAKKSPKAGILSSEFNTFVSMQMELLQLVYFHWQKEGKVVVLPFQEHTQLQFISLF